MKIIALGALIALITGSVWAESKESIPAEPQVAYRILMGYIQQKEKEAAIMQPIAGWTFLGVGTVAAASGVAMATTGDAFTQALCNTTLDSRTKFWTEVGLIGGGVTVAGLGGLLLTSPLPDLRLRFNDVLLTEDPTLQNRLAAATIKSLADEGKQKRVVSGWVGILTPVLTVSLTAAVNVQANKPWSENILALNSTEIVGMIGGVAQLFQTSPEEQLYEKYISALNTTVH